MVMKRVEALNLRSREAKAFEQCREMWVVGLKNSWCICINVLFFFKQKRQLRDQFIDFTHTTSAIAEQFLKSTNYDLELAINEYYLSYQPSTERKDNKKLAAIFDKYKDPDSDIIGIDGTIKYIEDLGYEPEDKVALALAEFLESPSAGVFERKSFILKWQTTQ